MTNITLMDVTFDRIPLKKNYTQISNELIQDVIKKKRLSVDSLTLMTVLYALYPEDERLTNFNAWMEMLGWGINKIKKAISDLAELGYIHIQKNRDQWGRFTHNSYQFYHSPADNPYFGKSSKEQELKTSENDVSSIAQNPCHGDEEKYIFYYNTSSCWSVSSVLGMEQTDFQQTEIVETVETADNEETLSDCIKQNIQQIVTEKPELQEKVSKLEMPIFVTYLVGVLRDALKKLKHPEAKGKFIKSIILNKINEFKAKKPAPNPTMKSVGETESTLQKPNYRTFQEILALIQSPYAWDMDFTCEEDFRNFDEMRKATVCTLPYELSKSKKDTITALEFLMHYSNYSGTNEDFDTRRYADFVRIVADCLAEIITTGYVGKKVVPYYEVLDKLNKINHTHGLDSLVGDFYEYWKWLVTETEIHNQSQYMKTVLYRFICEYGLEGIASFEMGKCAFRYARTQEIDRFDEPPAKNCYGKNVPMTREEREEMNAYLEKRFEDDSDSTSVPEPTPKSVPESQSIKLTPELPTKLMRERPKNLTDSILHFYEVETYELQFQKITGIQNLFFIAIKYSLIDETMIHDSILSDAKQFMGECEFSDYVNRLEEKAKTENSEFLEYVGYEKS